MRIALTKPLFAWDQLEDSPSLVTLKRLLESLPDGALLDGLRQARGRGRNDYPVQVLWGVVILTIALRHAAFDGGDGPPRLRRGSVMALRMGRAGQGRRDRPGQSLELT